MKLEDHPTVQRIRLKTKPSIPPNNEPLDATWLKQLVLNAGADDVGFVEIGRPALDDQREDIPPYQDTDQLRGSHESRGHSDTGSLGLQHRIPP